MRFGTPISAIGHALILGWGLFALPSNDPFSTEQVDALPVEFVTLDEFTDLQKGVETAPEVRNTEVLTDSKPEQTETASETVGPAEEQPVEPDNVPVPEAAPETVKQEAASTTEPVPEPKPEPVEEVQEETPPPAPTPKPEPANEPEPVETAKTQEADEISELLQQKPEEKPEEAPKPEVTEEVKPDTPPAPPIPRANPRPRRVAEKEVESTNDDVSKLISKEAPKTTNAGQQKEQASRGTKTGNANAKMTQSEIDGLRGAIRKCWTVPPGAAIGRDFSVQITMNMAPDGSVVGRPRVGKVTGIDGSLKRTVELYARNAVLECAPYSLPSAKYETWKVINVTFYP